MFENTLFTSTRLLFAPLSKALSYGYQDKSAISVFKGFYYGAYEI